LHGVRCALWRKYFKDRVEERDMPEVQLQVTVERAHRHNLAAVADRLGAAGMKVDQELASIGVLVGSADAAKVRALAEVEGVADVEPQETYQLPDPEYKDNREV
jgi:hypothetical protein